MLYPKERLQRKIVVVLGSREPSVQAFGQTALRAAGFGVLLESSGRGILEHLETGRPDAIVVDLLLEDMDAMELCSRIRRLPRGARLPVFVMTELVHAGVIHEIYARGATDFVRAPVNWQVLIHRIHRWAGQLQTLEQLREQKDELDEAQYSAMAASNQLVQLRNYDGLTGLPNRQLFVDTVDLALSQGERSGNTAAVLFIDVDGFKEVNDSIGRSRGDKVLQVLAHRLQGCIKDEDSAGGGELPGSLVARFGGDQFGVVVFRAADEGSAVELAERLRRAAGRPIVIDDQTLYLTVRIGISLSSPRLRDEELLVQQAESAARYCREQRHKPIAVFEDSMSDGVVRRLEVKNELREAIEGDELFLCYQAIVDCGSRRPRGVEGLIRWRHPERGPVPPADFLPVAEDSDLIVEIDRWALREGCGQAARWLEEGLPPVLMSLNVSKRFLEKEGFGAEVLTILAETGLAPGALQLELTERGSLPQDERILGQLRELAHEGVRLAIDDFGTGQTSLAYLRTFPVSAVKIDRSFIERVYADSTSAAITSAIVAMSHHLGLKVVAEGVEEQGQEEFLRDQRCHELQGYLYSHPVEAEEMTAYLRRRLEPAPPAAEPASAGSPAGESAAGAEAGAAPAPPDLEAVAGIGDGGSDSSQRLLRLARRDFLTGLFNRFAFDERFELAVAHADRFDHRVAILLIDLDDFKYINDTFGHAVGDGFLVAIAERLRQNVRRVDTLARLGGDEFVLVYSQVEGPESVTEFCRRLLTLLSRPVEVEGRELYVTASIGVSIYPDGGRSADELLRQADLALYRAKGDGGNTIRFHGREMDREVQRSLALARSLSGALSRGELFIEYQPQVSLASGSVVCVEALLRWRHPRDGLVAPDRFIPIAESTGEIVPIGEWVIASACAQARTWHAQTGRPLPVSVNLSTVQLRDPGFAETVMRAIDEAGVSPSQLELELSEGALARSAAALDGSLKRLVTSGIRLCLDDFGRGSSALAPLLQYPFDRVKLDGRLVRSVRRRSDLEAIRRGVLSMAREVGLKTLAEGVETAEEIERLRHDGCDAGQGYFFSRPLPSTALSELLSPPGNGGEGAARPHLRLISGGAADEPGPAEPASDGGPPLPDRGPLE